MHAVFTVVQIDPGKFDTAIQMLGDELIPPVKQAPGFVKGTWFGNAESGHGLVIFQTKEQAQHAAQPINANVADGIKVVSSDVYEIHAEA